MRFRYKYSYVNEFGNPRHIYTLIGRRGGVHFHVTDLGEKHRESFGKRYSSGLEFHFREPPEYMMNNAPSQDHCWLLQTPCWHDGTSLYAEEYLLPMWEATANDHEVMQRTLELEYKRNFEGVED